MANNIASHSIFESRVLRQLSIYFDRLKEGLDVSPAVRFRLEGYIAAGVDAGLLNEKEMNTLIETQVQKDPVAVAYELAGEQSLGPYIVCVPSSKLPGREEGWVEVRLPYLVQRAPVFPTS